jgi:hypothetical protein
VSLVLYLISLCLPAHDTTLRGSTTLWGGQLFCLGFCGLPAPLLEHSPPNTPPLSVIIWTWLANPLYWIGLNRIRSRTAGGLLAASILGASAAALALVCLLDSLVLDWLFHGPMLLGYYTWLASFLVVTLGSLWLLSRCLRPGGELRSGLDRQLQQHHAEQAQADDRVDLKERLVDPTQIVGADE